ncbi:hypothetical protein B0H13DRAFT_2578770 [Mycena leptocephala]|nr:hypothetical protein B0H13DRAFT_2578770 [Mycena leptocephala]
MYLNSYCMLASRLRHGLPSPGVIGGDRSDWNFDPEYPHASGTLSSLFSMISAKIDGRKAHLAVAVYQGRGAKEEWQEDMERYSRLRPQLCRFASSSTMHAAVFNDDLIPLEHFLELYRHSPILNPYIRAYCVLRIYFASVFQQSLHSDDCTFWIRRSTGRLCADLIPSNSLKWGYYSGEMSLQGITSLDALDQDAKVIDSLTIEDYHSICDWPQRRFLFINISTDVTINLGTIIAVSSGDQLKGSAEIAFLPDVEAEVEHWYGAQGEVMEDGWTRVYSSFNSSDVLNRTLWENMWKLHEESWLSQANHIFSRLGITSDPEDYLAVRDIGFRIEISGTTADGPSGYLFLCPAMDFKVGSTTFRWPDCPAYWSLDPAGVECLSMAEATCLGFPVLQFTTQVMGRSWDASFYAGLRQFHRAKGFDPASQDVARHLGHRLFQLSNEIDPLFAHVDPDDPGAEEQDEEPISSSLLDDIPPMLFLM